MLDELQQLLSAGLPDRLGLGPEELRQLSEVLRLPGWSR